MKRKILSLLLALLMTGSSLAMFACGESEVNKDTETANAPAANETVIDEIVEPEETEPVNSRLAIPDDLPEVKYNGAELRILAEDIVSSYEYIKEIEVEELTGDSCNDSIYNRNLSIEQRFDVEIKAFSMANSQNQASIVATSGVDDYHIIGFQNFLATIPINAKALLNWLDAPYVNLDKPWHNALANEDATINGKLFAICSDLSISSMTFTHAIFANIDLLNNYGYTADDIYNTVKEGSWTFDKLTTMAEGMYIDVNGDGIADVDDRYGFGYSTINPADAWFIAFGGKICDVDSETGEVKLTFMSDRTVEMFDALYNFHYNNPGYIKLPNQYDEETYFLNNKLVMAPMRFQAAYKALRDMESTYTMIPFPKWEEAQEAYYTMADDKFTDFAMPTSVAKDIEFISVIFEALCAESYKTVYPVYYDQALKGRYSSDPTTAEMVDLIMEGRAFDFSFQFPTDVFQRLPHLFRDLINDKNPNIASKAKTSEKLAKTTIKKILNRAYDL